MAVVLFAAVDASASNYIYALRGTASQNIWRIDTVSNTETQVVTGYPGGSAATLAQCPNGRVYYVINAANPAVYVWDPATPATPPSALPSTLGGGVAASFRLACNSAGTLYYMPDSGVLYTVNVTTGVATAGPTVTGIGSGGDMAFNAAGVLYVLNSARQLFTAPIGGGAATTIGTLTGITNATLGLAFNSAGTAFVQVQNPSQLRSFTPPAVATTLVRALSGGTTATGDLASTTVISPTVAKAFSPATISPGATSVLTITLTNPNAGVALRGAALTDTYPAGVVTSSLSPPSTTCAGGTVSTTSGSVSLAGGTIPAAGSCTVSVTVTAASAGSYVNTIAAGAVSTAQATSDAAASATLTVSTVANLGITKTDGATTEVPGTAVTYTIVASNAGPSAVTGATVADTLPVAVTGVTWTCVGAAGGSCPVSGSGNISALVNLPVGGSATFTVTGTVSATATGSLVNTATITAPGGVTDPTPGNNSATDTDTLSPQADLTISKTDGVTSVVPGTSLTYTIVAGNAGPSTAANATVTDTFPASLTGATWTCVASGGASCPASGSGNINAAVTLPVGATATFTATGTVSASATGTLANTATITAPGGVTDPTPGNNSATDTDTLTPQADLAITKTDGAATEVPGTSITYTIVASNAGPSTATGATVADTFGAALTGMTWTCVAAGGASCPASGSGNISALVSLPVGGTATFTATGTVSASATGTLVNTATITAPGGVTDPTPGNNSATDTDTLSAQADLAVTKTDGSVTATPGAGIAYTIVASNAGPSTAAGATVTDTFGAALTGMTWTCAAAGGASCPASGSGNIGAAVTLPVGGTATFTATGTVSATATGSLVNTATVAAPGGVTDPTPGNNSATDTDTLTPQADLAITKTDGSATATPGAAITYTIVAGNAGPSAVVGATVTDTFGAALTGMTWTCVAAGGASCPASGSGNIGAAVTLTVGGTATFTVTGTVSASATGTLANTATIAAPGGVTDPNAANDSATDTDTLGGQADLGITKTDGVATAVPGSPLTYTIVASNAGPSAVTGATVSDTFSGIFTGISWTCAAAGGATCPASGSGNISAAVTLTVGGTATFTVTGTVAASATGTLANTATIAAPGGVTDPNAANDSATDTDTLSAQADLTVTKSGAPSPYVPGAALTYTIVATNLGPSVVAGATVSDPLPAAFSSFTWTCTASAGSSCPTSGGPSGLTAAVTLLVGGTATFTVTGTVPPGTTGAQNNTVTVTVPGGVTDPVPGNNQASNTNPVGPRADLQITKSSSPNPYVPGAALTYTITATNVGPSDVTGARVQDALPAALSGFTWSCTGAAGGACGTASGSGDIDALVTLPVGATASFTVTGTVPASLTGVLVNTATIAAPSGTTDPNAANNTSTDSNNASLQSDLAVTKTASPVNYVPGASFTYTIVASNAGPSTAVNARVQDALPSPLSGFTWTCAAAGGAACGTVSGAGDIDVLVTLPVGGTATFTVTGTAPPSLTGPVVNTVVITPPAGTADPNSSDNSATNTSQASATADLRVTKASSPNPYVPGLPLTYTIVATNLGPSAVTAAQVTDTLPPALGAFTWTCVGGAGGSCVNASGVGDVSALVDLPVSGTATFTVTGTVPANLTGSLVNTASITPPAGVDDPTPGNNNATDVNTGAPQADLSITKTDGLATEVPGTSVTYTIVASNAGPSAATGATVTDTFGPSLTAMTWTCVAAGGASCPASGSGNINAAVTLTVGGTATFTVTGTVSATATGSLVNTATITVPGGVTDPTPGNNSATDTDTLSPQADSHHLQDRRRDIGRARHVADLHHRRRQRRTQHGHRCHGDRHVRRGAHGDGVDVCGGGRGELPGQRERQRQRSRHAAGGWHGHFHGDRHSGGHGDGDAGEHSDHRRAGRGDRPDAREQQRHRYRHAHAPGRSGNHEDRRRGDRGAGHVDHVHHRGEQRRTQHGHRRHGDRHVRRIAHGHDLDLCGGRRGELPGQWQRQHQCGRHAAGRWHRHLHGDGHGVGHGHGFSREHCHHHGARRGDRPGAGEQQRHRHRHAEPAGGSHHLQDRRQCHDDAGSGGHLHHHRHQRRTERGHECNRE